MLPSPSIHVGQTVIKGGVEYTVSEIDGDVIGLRHPHGSFAMYTTVDLVHVQLELDLPPVTNQPMACSMPAPAVAVMGGTRRPVSHRLLRLPLGFWKCNAVRNEHGHPRVLIGSVLGARERRA